MSAWTIYTYGGGDYLYLTLNAVAALMGGADYMGLIKIFMVLGAFWVLAQLSLHQSMDWHWIVMFMIMFNIFFVPKKNIVIVDHFNPGATRVVANVPFGLASIAWLANTMGDGLTRLADSAFSLPGDLKYESTGMAFGSRLITSINNARFDDPLLNQNLVEYAKQCAYMNMLYGFYTVNDVYHSQNLKDLILSTTRNSDIRGMFYTNGSGHSRTGHPSGSSTYMACRQAAKHLRADITPIVDHTLLRYARMLFNQSGQTDAQKKARLMAAIPAGYGYMAAVSGTAQQLLTQATLSNYYENAYGDVAAMMGNQAAATAYATAVAERQQRSAYRTMATIAEKMLPLIRNIIQMVAYASFFIVFLALMLPITVSGGALITYIKIIVWVELWPILYAIINGGMLIGAKGYTQIAMWGKSDISMASMHTMSAVNSDMSIIAGYLSMSVPLITWMFVTKGGFAASQLAAGIFAPSAQAANQAGGEISRGNISSGNLSVGNENIMQGQSAPHMTTGGELIDGSHINRFSSNGGTQMENRQDNMGVNVSKSIGVSHASSAALSHATANETTLSAQVQRTSRQESADLHSFAQTAGTNQKIGISKETKDTIGDGTHYSTTSEQARQWGQDHNMTDAQTSRALAYVDAHGGFDSGGTIWGKALKAGAGLSFGVEAGGRGETGTSSSNTHTLTEGNVAKEGATLAKSYKVDNDLVNAASKVDSGSSGYAAAELKAETHSYQQAHKQTEELRTQDQRIQQTAGTITTNMNNSLDQYIRDHGGSAQQMDTPQLTAVATSNGFTGYAEGVLAKEGIHLDLDKNGVITGWASEIARNGIPSTKGAPTSITKPPEDHATPAIKGAGFVPGVTPTTAATTKAKAMLHDGQQRANADQGVINKGGKQVNNTVNTDKTRMGKVDPSTRNRVEKKVGTDLSNIHPLNDHTLPKGATPQEPDHLIGDAIDYWFGTDSKGDKK